MLVSKTGAAFVMDVGSPRIVDQLKQRLEQDEIKSIEGLWVTHYHYDHTDGILTFQREFDCPCMTDRTRSGSARLVPRWIARVNGRM